MSMEVLGVKEGKMAGRVEGRNNGTYIEGSRE